MDGQNGGDNISIVVNGSNYGEINVKNIYNRLQEAGLTAARDPEVARQQLLVFEVLATKFSEEELRALCLELGLDYEDLGGEGKRGKARALVEYFTRRDQLDMLKARVRALRPGAFKE